MKSLTPRPKLGTMLIMGEMHPTIKPSYTLPTSQYYKSFTSPYFVVASHQTNPCFFCCKNNETNPHYIVAKIIKQIHVFVVANLQTDPCFGCCKFHTNSEIH
jgi:hypothetical protein